MVNHRTNISQYKHIL